MKMAEESPPSLPPISTLRSLPPTKHVEILSLLFEPSETLIALFAPLLFKQPFDSYDSLISTVAHQLRELAASKDAADGEALEDILASHPRLGEKKVHSALSQMEQKAMENASQTGQETDEAKKLEEQEILKSLNEEYEKTFPGLRYV
jgi:2-oxo-4-hydroxy-4-carboxy--5-ureidoimidazoline (OHCU) decarboxylase